MARPLRIEYPFAFYHVIQHGIERKKIFMSERDNEKFLSYVGFAHKAYGAVIHTYTLMDNHYHFAIETPRGNLSKIMHYLNTSYAIYFNITRKRRGPLYQGRYKAILVEKDEYLHHLSRYIHLNPVRANIANNPIEYHWSSYKYFVSKSNPPEWLNINFILSMFDSDITKAKKMYNDFVLSGIDTEKDTITQNTKNGFLGTQNFFEHVKKRFANLREDPEVPLLKDLKRKDTININNILEAVQRMSINNQKTKKGIIIYLMRKFIGMSLKDISSFYNNDIKYKNVSKICGNVEKERKQNRNLNTMINQVEDFLIMANGET